MQNCQNSVKKKDKKKAKKRKRKFIMVLTLEGAEKVCVTYS